jgi:hypothetical protein
MTVPDSNESSRQCAAVTVSLVFADRRVEVAESTIELAEMALADHGEVVARGLLRELIPTLTLLEAGAAVAEAKRRLTILNGGKQ